MSFEAEGTCSGNGSCGDLSHPRHLHCTICGEGAPVERFRPTIPDSSPFWFLNVDAGTWISRHYAGHRKEMNSTTQCPGTQDASEVAKQGCGWRRGKAIAMNNIKSFVDDLMDYRLDTSVMDMVATLFVVVVSMLLIGVVIGGAIGLALAALVHYASLGLLAALFGMLYVVSLGYLWRGWRRRESQKRWRGEF